jgi:hypothetical protein
VVWPSGRAVPSSFWPTRAARDLQETVQKAPGFHRGMNGRNVRRFRRYRTDSNPWMSTPRAQYAKLSNTNSCPPQSQTVRRQRHILGAHVLGEYSVEVIQTVAACMTAGMRIEQLAELQLAYPTVTEALGLAARRLVRELGVVPMAPSWDDVEPQLSTAYT